MTIHFLSAEEIPLSKAGPGRRRRPPLLTEILRFTCGDERLNFTKVSRATPKRRHTAATDSPSSSIAIISVLRLARNFCLVQLPFLLPRTTPPLGLPDRQSLLGPHRNQIAFDLGHETSVTIRVSPFLMRFSSPPSFRSQPLVLPLATSVTQLSIFSILASAKRRISSFWLSGFCLLVLTLKYPTIIILHFLS